MVDEFEKKCPRIDMFVLCWEKGKFDKGFQTTVETYLHLLKDKKLFWESMVAVITKQGYSEDYEEDEEGKERTESEAV